MIWIIQFSTISTFFWQNYQLFYFFSLYGYFWVLYIISGTLPSFLGEISVPFFVFQIFYNKWNFPSAQFWHLNEHQHRYSYSSCIVEEIQHQFSQKYILCTRHPNPKAVIIYLCLLFSSCHLKFIMLDNSRLFACFSENSWQFAYYFGK